MMTCIRLVSIVDLGLQEATQAACQIASRDPDRSQVCYPFPGPRLRRTHLPGAICPRRRPRRQAPRPPGRPVHRLVSLYKVSYIVYKVCRGLKPSTSIRRLAGCGMALRGSLSSTERFPPHGPFSPSTRSAVASQEDDSTRSSTPIRNQSTLAWTAPHTIHSPAESLTNPVERG